jgi:hypothetical protein
VEVCKAYDIANIPQLYPAANKSIQIRLQNFVNQGILAIKTNNIESKMACPRAFP